MKVFKPFLAYNYFNKFEKSNNFSRFVCPYNFEVFLKSKDSVFSKNEHNIFNFKEEKNGKEKLKNWLDSSVLVSTKKPSFYVYEMSYKIYGELYSFIGIIGALKLPEKDENFVITCEETLESEVDFQFNFLKNCGFSSSPICAFYEEENENGIFNIIKNKMTSSYIFKAKQNNVIHKIWKIDEDEAVRIILDFFKDKVYYVFNGSEKFKAAIKYRNFLKEGEEPFNESSNYVMTLLFSKNNFSFLGLPVHRLVGGIGFFDSEEILKKASRFFDLKLCKTLDSMRNILFNFKREGKNAVGFYADGCYHVLSLKDTDILSKIGDGKFAFEKFDVYVLNKLLFQYILGIDLENVEYCYVDENAVFAVDCGDASFAVFLSAIRSSEFFEVLSCKEKMPKKSLYFFPRPVEGLLIYSVI